MTQRMTTGRLGDTIELGDLEKKALLEEYRKWSDGCGGSRRPEPLFFTPVTMERDEIVEEMRFIYNSSLKFIPPFMMWRLAELLCTMGKAVGLVSLELKGKRLIKTLKNFRSISQ